MLRIQEITGAQAFDAVQMDWRGLLDADGHATPLLSHEWLSCALAACGQGKTPAVLLVRNDDGLLGAAPFWEHRDVIRGIPVRRMQFITTPDTAFADFVCRPHWRDDVLRRWVDHLYGDRRRSWDIVTLGRWPADSPNWTPLTALLTQAGKRFSTASSSVIPYVAIKGQWSAFLQSRSSRFRKTHRNIINRVEKLPNVQVQRVCSDASGGVLADLMHVAERSWKHAEGVSIASQPTARRFFEDLTSRATERKWLSVWFLKTDGVPVAAEYDLECQGRVYALRADFDDAYREYSPGSYLEFQILKYLFEHEYSEYSFGPGLNTYKLHWTDEYKHNVTLQLYNDTLAGRLLWGLENRLLPLLRRLRRLRAGAGRGPHEA
jgi:CelD/BcsL family acetyltransferase involved in cellulose biosynthesis